MKSNLRMLAIAVAVLFAIGQSQTEGAQLFMGKVKGVELITQDIGGRAVFLIRFIGTINGRQRSGIGVVGMNHTALPADENKMAEITGGDGRLYVGFRSYAITDVSGTIETDGPFFFGFPLRFNVKAMFMINGKLHQFDGVLRHDTFPFSISGDLTPILPPS